MLERLWKKVLRRSPYSLWDIPAFFLWLMSFPFRWGVMLARRRLASAKRLSTPVISVGNLTVGGSGKTPLVKFIARDLLREGIRTGIVSSAYRREDDKPFLKSGYEVADLPVSATGDEVRLLAHALPEAWFSVDEDKTRAAELLSKSGNVDVIIIDDGFQHFDLYRDIDIVAYDAGVKKRHLNWFPYGMLRESVASLSRADMIIVTRSRFARDLNAIKRRVRKLAPKADLYHAAFVTQNIHGREQSHSAKYLKDKSVFLFAGVGNFLALKRQVSALTVDLDHWVELSDHQTYSADILKMLREKAEEYESDVVLTTEKDWVKIGDFDFEREFYYLDLLVDLDPGEEKFIARVMERLGLEGYHD